MKRNNIQAVEDREDNTKDLEVLQKIQKLDKVGTFPSKKSQR